MVEQAGPVFEETGEKTEQTQETTEETQQAGSAPKIDSKYRLIILAAQRTKQLQRGAQPRIHLDPRKHKPTRIALKEVETGRVNFETLID